MTGFTAADVADQIGKCFLVTGANTGIGLEVARVLAARGARVLLACRDEGKALAAIADIRAGCPTANLAFVPLDLADLASVRRAFEIVAAEPRLDVLVNNAGFGIYGDFAEVAWEREKAMRGQRVSPWLTPSQSDSTVTIGFNPVWNV